MKIVLLSTLLLLTTGIAIAQKTNSTYTAPSAIKVDGIANEWRGKYRNYNRKNELRYTLTNDNKNLYLVIYSVDELAIGKICTGGLTFTISKSSDSRQKKKELSQATIQYPVIDLKKDGTGIDNIVREYKDYKQDTIKNSLSIDSLRNTANTRFTENHKLIKVTGITAVADTFISIYNTQSIKAAAKFDKHLAYVFELAIPLKYLVLNAATPIKLSYNIKLNGPPSADEWLKAQRFPPPMVRSDGGGVDYKYEFLNNPTDFWGEYTLAK